MNKFDVNTLRNIMQAYPKCADYLMREMAQAADCEGMEAFLDSGYDSYSHFSSAIQCLDVDDGLMARTVAERWLQAAQARESDVFIKFLIKDRGQFSGGSQLTEKGGLAFMRLAIKLGLDPMQMVEIDGPASARLTLPNFYDRTVSGGNGISQISMAAWVGLADVTSGAVVAAKIIRDMALKPDCPGAFKATEDRSFSLMEMLVMGCKHLALDAFLDDIGARYGIEVQQAAAQAGMDFFVPHFANMSEKYRNYVSSNVWHPDNRFSRTAATLLGHCASLSPQQCEQMEDTWICKGNGENKFQVKLAHCFAAFNPARDLGDKHGRDFARNQLAQVDGELASRHVELSVRALQRLQSLSLDSTHATATDGRAPLHFAAEAGNAETYAALIGLGADPKQKDKRNWTAESYAKKVSADFGALTRSIAAQHVIQAPITEIKPLAP